MAWDGIEGEACVGKPRGGSLVGKMDRALAMQPFPIYTGVGECEESDTTQIMRLWQPGDAATCRLCRSCSAMTLANGVAICLVEAPGDVETEEGAALYDATAAPSHRLRMFDPS
jgi:hypothetical protein